MLRFWSITAIFTLLSHRYICGRLSGESIQICRFTYYTCLLLLDHYRELIKQSQAAYVNEVINIWTRWDVSEVARMEKSKRGNSKSTQFCLFLINPKSSLALFHRLHKKIGYLKSSGDIFKSNAISHIKIQSLRIVASVITSVRVCRTPNPWRNSCTRRTSKNCPVKRRCGRSPSPLNQILLQREVWRACSQTLHCCT